jgi:hypothetical protein
LLSLSWIEATRTLVIAFVPSLSVGTKVTSELNGFRKGDSYSAGNGDAWPAEVTVQESSCRCPYPAPNKTRSMCERLVEGMQNDALPT